MKYFHVFCILLFSLGLTLPTFGQINNGEKYIVLTKGETYIDTIKSNFPIVSIVPLAENCYISEIKSLGNKSYKLTIKPLQSNPNYVGNAKVSIQYTDSFKPRYITWNIKYVNSKISTKDDYIAFYDNSEIAVKPLENDITSSTELTITGLAMVSGGVAEFEGDEVYFIPESDADEGYVVYGVKDDAGASASGIIKFIRQSETFVQSDTVWVSIQNTGSQLMKLPSDDFTLIGTPNKGHVEFQAPFVAKYYPSSKQIGTETLVFEDYLGNSRVFVIEVISKNQNTSSIRDDIFYTPKNTSITFDVFENDLSANFPIMAYSPELTYEGNGVFSYTPPTNFSGVKNFYYKVNYGQWQSEGKIAIYIGNYQPMKTNDYNFNIIKNHPLVLNYDVPVDGYAFNLLNQPAFGTVEIFDNTLVGEGCDIFFSKSTLIYTPDYQYYGRDSFDVEYCVVNNPCTIYKLHINIHDRAADTLCHCVGPDCVWAGDTNGDGRVSVTDLLPIARFIGQSGTARQDIEYSFRSGQQAENWEDLQPNGLNIKHVDADGDGLITAEDTLSIHEYYSNIHKLVPEEILAIKDYEFNLVPNATEVDSGDLLIIDIVLGSASKPVYDLFGMAFGINLAPELVDTSSLAIEYSSDSWLTSGGPYLNMTKQPAAGVLHSAITKVDAIVEDELEGFRPPGANGYGIVGKLYAIVEDELEGFKSEDGYVTYRISTDGIQMETTAGEQFRIPDTYVDIRVNRNKDEVAIPTEDKLILFPNPVNGRALMHFNGSNIIKSYSIHDAVGNLVSQVENLEKQSVYLKTTGYATGIYYVRVVTSQGVITKKMMVINDK